MENNNDSTEYEVCCLHPLWIRQPKWYDAVMTCDKFVYLGRTYDISPYRRFRVYEGQSIYHVFNLRYVSDPNRDARQFSYFYHSGTGLCIPFFVQVPCGKCDACRKKYRDGLIQRGSLGCEESTGDILYVTLTYNNPHLPKNCLPDRRDLVLFKKRLSKTISDLTGRNPKYFLKYFAFAEAGKEHGRPHYHILIYNFPDFRGLGIHEKLFKTQLVQFCWRENERVGKHSLCFKDYMYRGYDVYNQVPGSSRYDNRSYGFVNLEILDSSKACKYVSKYVTKEQDHDGICFHSVSCNLGVEFVRSRFEHCFNNINRKFEYISVFGEFKSIGLHSYYINKLLPSESVKLPVDVRRAICHVNFLTQYITDNNKFFDDSIVKRAIDVRLDLHDNFPLFQPLQISAYYDKKENYVPSGDCVKLVDRFVDHINAYLSSPVDMAPRLSRDLYFRSMEFTPGEYAIIKAKQFRKELSKLRSKSFL